MVYKNIYQDLSLVITLVNVERLGSLHDASVPVIWRIPRRNGNKTARTGNRGGRGSRFAGLHLQSIASKNTNGPKLDVAQRWLS